MWRSAKLWIGSTLGSWVLRILWASYRVRMDEQTAKTLHQLPTPAIFVYWHDHIFASSPFLTKVLLRRRKVAVMISESEDGELVARAIRRLGLSVVRGSSSRGGSKALRGLYRFVRNTQASPVMLPDGPQGPAFEAKPGAVVLSQMTQAPLVPLAFRCSRSWRLGSWDRMFFPVPFARIEVACGEPWQIPRTLEGPDLENHTQNLSERISTIRNMLA